MFRIVSILLCFSVLIACRKETIIQDKNNKFDFVVAGHAYGNPLVYQLRLYRPLVPILGNFSNYVQPKQFIFTGDVVAKPTEENWRNVLNEFDSLKINYWIAPGNHDIATDFFIEGVQDSYSFVKREANNLFLILNTNFGGWTVDSEQLILIETALNDLEDIKNIFVFSHHIWWSKLEYAHFNNMDTIVTNSDYLINGPSNFWIDAFPLFESLEIPIYFFAGDVGALDFIPAYSEQHFGNFHFYTSGLGGGVDDNVLHVKVAQTGKVEVDKINF